MSSKYKVHGDASKEFVRVFDSLCGARARWTIWTDFLHLAAYSISNVVDTVHREKREKDYMTISKSYTKKEMLGFSELFAIVVTALDENPNQDFLGHIYMGLELGNKNTGQFFTPYDVAKMCALVSVDLEEIERRTFATAHDCCIGGGAMLIGLANAIHEKGINYQRKVMFVAQDIDHNCCCMAYIQLSLLGCPGYVVCGDSITTPLTGNPLFAPMDRETFITPMYCAVDWDIRRCYHLVLEAIGMKPSEINGERALDAVGKEPAHDENEASAPAVEPTEEKSDEPTDSLVDDTTEETEMIQMTFFD